MSGPKRKLHIIVQIILLNVLSLQLALAQPAVLRDTVYIARFLGDRSAAVAYTFDDGIKDQFTIAYPMLKEYGFPATFFIVPSQVSPCENDTSIFRGSSVNPNRISLCELKIMSSHGMEIANHSWSHTKNLTKVTEGELVEEIEKASDAIQKMTGKRPLTFAYPWNAFNAKTQSIVLQTHIASRESQFGIGSNFSTEMGNRWIDGLIGRHAWGVAMIHAISSGFDALKSPEELKKHFEYVKQHENRIWVTSFASLTKYRVTRESSLLSVKRQKKRMIIKLTASHLKEIYDEPLTLVVQFKVEPTDINVIQGSKNVSFSYNAGKLLLNVLPNQRNIEVYWK